MINLQHGEFKAGFTNQFIFRIFRKDRSKLHVSLTLPHNLHAYTAAGGSEETRGYRQLTTKNQNKQRPKC